MHLRNCRAREPKAQSRAPYSKKPEAISQPRAFPRNTPGSDLLSHAVARTVPSAVAGLTSVFGMGTGVTLLLLPPGKTADAAPGLGLKA
jgi:hypothetical protein